MEEIERVIERLKQLEHCITKSCDETCTYYEDDMYHCHYDVSTEETINEAIQTIRELQSKSQITNGGLFVPLAEVEALQREFHIERDRLLEQIKELQSKSEEVCEWRIVDRPNGFPIFNTSCGAIRLACAKGIDIYCNACGKKIKVVE